MVYVRRYRFVDVYERKRFYERWSGSNWAIFDEGDGILWDDGGAFH